MVEHMIAASVGGGLTALFLALGARGERRRAGARAAAPRPVGPVTLTLAVDNETRARDTDRVVRELEARILRLDAR
jgi:hypothetical protein